MTSISSFMMLNRVKENNCVSDTKRYIECLYGKCINIDDISIKVCRNKINVTTILKDEKGNLYSCQNFHHSER